MVLDPGTAMLIASAVSAAAQGIGSKIAGKKQKKSARLRSKEAKRETNANLLNEANNREAEEHTNHLSSRARLRKRSSQSLQDTSDLVRGALKI
jgi:hypothetical protein